MEELDVVKRTTDEPLQCLVSVRDVVRFLFPVVDQDVIRVPVSFLHCTHFQSSHFISMCSLLSVSMHLYLFTLGLRRVAEIWICTNINVNTMHLM